MRVTFLEVSLCLQDDVGCGVFVSPVPFGLLFHPVSKGGGVFLIGQDITGEGVDLLLESHRVFSVWLWLGGLSLTNFIYKNKTPNLVVEHITTQTLGSW